jgi:hypothetical protein
MFGFTVRGFLAGVFMGTSLGVLAWAGSGLAQAQTQSEAAVKRPPAQVWSTRDVNPNPAVNSGAVILGGSGTGSSNIVVVPQVSVPGVPGVPGSPRHDRPGLSKPSAGGGVVDLRERP